MTRTIDHLREWGVAYLVAAFSIVQVFTYLVESIWLQAYLLMGQLLALSYLIMRTIARSGERLEGKVDLLLGGEEAGVIEIVNLQIGQRFVINRHRYIVTTISVGSQGELSIDFLTDYRYRGKRMIRL